MEAEKVGYCFKDIGKYSRKKLISENRSLPRSKKAEKVSKGLGACSSRGAGKRRNCRKGHRAASDIPQVVKWKPWFWRKLQSFLQLIKLLRGQIPGLKTRILFEQSEMDRKWFVYKPSSIYILPHLAASRFSNKNTETKVIFYSVIEILKLLVYLEEITVKEGFKQTPLKVLVYMCKYKDKLFRNRSCKLM